LAQVVQRREEVARAQGAVQAQAEEEEGAAEEEQAAGMPASRAIHSDLWAGVRSLRLLFLLSLASQGMNFYAIQKTTIE
jgi:hypothetical protein